MERKELKKHKGYTVSSDGEVYDPYNNKVYAFTNPCGYKAVELDGSIATVAYLVAQSFVDNPDDCVCVGYKDGDYGNVSAGNLYWYGESLLKTDGLLDKEIVSVDEYGNIRDSFSDGYEAMEVLGKARQSIIAKCRGQQNSKDDFFLFWVGDFTEEALEERVKEKEERERERLEKAEAAREARRGKALAAFTEGRRDGTIKPDNNHPVLLLNGDGTVFKEYVGKYAMLEELGISWSKLNRALNVTGKLDGHYVIGKEDYDGIDVKKFIGAVDRLEVNQRCKPVVCYGFDGVEVARYKSVVVASRRTGISTSKLYDALKGKCKQTGGYVWRWAGDALGKFPLPTVREKKASVARTRRNKRKVIQYDFAGTVLKVFGTTKEASGATGISSDRIYQVLVGKCKQTGGFVWRYEEDSFDKFRLPKVK